MENPIPKEKTSCKRCKRGMMILMMLFVILIFVAGRLIINQYYAYAK
jgi:hypothetical protein